MIRRVIMIWLLGAIAAGFDFPCYGMCVSGSIQDPAGVSGGINFYRYAGNDPLNFIDPLGLNALGAFAGSDLGGTIGSYIGALGAGLLGELGGGAAGTAAEPGGGTVAGGLAGAAAAADIGADVGGTIGSYLGGKLGDLLTGDDAGASSPSLSIPNATVNTPVKPTPPIICTSKNGGPKLPKNPDDLLKNGNKETSNPDAAKAGHRTFENPDTGDKLRFDQGEPGAPGHAGEDHYHHYNPNSTGSSDQYLDSNGNPTPRGSDPSHLYP